MARQLRETGKALKEKDLYFRISLRIDWRLFYFILFYNT